MAAALPLGWLRLMTVTWTPSGIVSPTPPLSGWAWWSFERLVKRTSTWRRPSLQGTGGSVNRASPSNPCIISRDIRSACVVLRVFDTGR
jgi:hypothetical protein